MKDKRLVVISHTPHYQNDGEVVGWGPTVRELDYLAALFAEIVHIAILYPSDAPPSSHPYVASNIKLQLLPPSGGEKWHDKLGIIRELPRYWRAIGEALDSADYVHVRCPANIALLALLQLSLRRKPTARWFKFAGNWSPKKVDYAGYELQRRLLRHNWARGQVTVNGQWADQPTHVQMFHNPSLTKEELRQGRLTAQAKQLELPLRFLFVGRVESAKGVGRVLNIVADVRQRGFSAEVDIVGDGPERAKFQAQARSLSLTDCVTFHGWLQRTELDTLYAKAHFLLHPSTASEGWPKVVSEAMANGAVPLTSDVSSMPQMLKQMGAGLSFPFDNLSDMCEKIVDLVQHPEEWQSMRDAGVCAAENFSYSAHQQAVISLYQKLGS